MKFYLASRYRNKEKLLKLAQLLAEGKHTVVSSWLGTGSLKPYEENRVHSRKMAAKITREVKACDVFVLLTDRAGTDMFIEFGLAVAFRKKVLLVGKWNKRSLMHFHPQVIQVDSLKDVATMFV